jgi:hypothetical protein
MQVPNSFSNGSWSLDCCARALRTQRNFNQFVASLEGRVVEIKPDEIGSSAIDNAYGDFLNSDRSALMAQELVNAIYRIKRLGKPPKVSVEVNEIEDGRFRVDWNNPLNQLPAVEIEINIKAPELYR